MPVHTETAAQLADDPAGFLSLSAFYTATVPDDLQRLLGQRAAVLIDSGTQSNAEILQTLFFIKKARTTADAFSGIHVRNELRTGVILAEDINILKK